MTTIDITYHSDCSKYFVQIPDDLDGHHMAVELAMVMLNRGYHIETIIESLISAAHELNDQTGKPVDLSTISTR